MHDCRIVLVRTHYAGNLGATARVMRNFGMTQLVLVDPIADPRDHEARRLSTHGECVLDQARILPTLREAISDCVFVAATSARTGGIMRNSSTEILSALIPRAKRACEHGPVALVFGPEPTGLTTAETSLCHALMHIPTHEEYPALNLAQAVAICIYEWNRHVAPAPDDPSPASTPVLFSELEPMFEHLRQGLQDIHFLYGEKADSLMHALRLLIGRAAPTHAEVKILHGLARQLEWVARHRPPGDFSS